MRLERRTHTHFSCSFVRRVKAKRISLENRDWQQPLSLRNESKANGRPGYERKENITLHIWKEYIWRYRSEVKRDLPYTFLLFSAMTFCQTVLLFHSNFCRYQCKCRSPFFLFFYFPAEYFSSFAKLRLCLFSVKLQAAVETAAASGRDEKYIHEHKLWNLNTPTV